MESTTLEIKVPEPTTAETAANWIGVGFIGLLAVGCLTLGGVAAYDYMKERKIRNKEMEKAKKAFDAAMKD